MKLDPIDYKEPSCALCGGEEFYYPDPSAPKGKIPVDRIILKLDGFLNKNRMTDAKRHLEYWLSEAVALGDKNGELTIQNELLGLYRKTRKRGKGLAAVERSVELVRELNVANEVSGATILLNAATTKKAFGEAESAMPLYAEAEAVYRRDLPQNDERLAGLFNNRALAEADLKLYKEAEADFNAALEVLAESEISDNEIAMTYVNLAHLYAETGEEEKIKDCLDYAKIYLDSERIVQNAYHAFVCSKCAPSYKYFGEEAYAEELRLRARGLYERA